MKWVGRIAGGFAAVILLLWAFGPYEPADLATDFDAGELDRGVSAYLNWREAQVDGITPGVEKQVIWAGAPETATEWAVVYIHGFSATAQEIRPVPDRVAEALGANLVLTRLQGHGRGAEAMAEGTVAGWMNDTAEALAIANKISDRTLVISTSTGGTLVAAAAVDAGLMQEVAGAVMISPNFAVNNPAAPLLTLPAARYWVPLIAGDRRSFEPLNDDQARYWTTKYPSTAVMPMAALVKAVDRLDLSDTETPALFIFSDEDQVVDATATRAALAEWGGRQHSGRRS
ncbi:alpha/beta hydrolase [Sulfitobacter albidus]|uniref:alpha/beta hydrolase n=1 Tax=Sulfitobacter albidus TaxID=2829501 RepID=UPI0020C8D301|nr:alpha/beta fold hydrolase [Sulfitobacter albidus]